MNLFTNLFTMPRRVSMREIAKAAGVSLATVSYALRGHRKIPENTQQRIQAIADKLGYQADPSFAVLGARRWENKSSYNGLSIAYIAGRRSQWTRFQKRCYKGCEEQAQLLGYRLQYFCHDDFESPAHLGEVLEHRAFTGVIFRRINSRDHIDGFPFDRFAVVACGCGTVDPGCHLVLPHHHHNISSTWNYLYRQGHRRIGCILLENDPLSELPEFYIGAFLQAQQQVKASQRIPIHLCKQHDKKHLAQWLQRWKPDAIIGCVEYIHNWIIEHKLNPNPVFSCLEKIDMHNTQVAGIDLRPQLMGSITVDQIDRAIRANERGLPEIRQCIHIESSWCN